MPGAQGHITVRRRPKDGVNGINTATVFLYNRPTGTPDDAPHTNTTYDFATKVLSGSFSPWSQTIPVDNGHPCYVTMATAASNTATDVIPSSEWCTARKLASNGAKTAVVFLYKRGTSAPTREFTNNLIYNFTTKTLSSEPTGWFKAIPAGTNPLYVMAATAYSVEEEDTIVATEWSTPVLFVANGLNAVVATLSNPFVGVQATYSGEVPSYAGTGTSLWVMEGNTTLKLLSQSVPAPGEYSISIDATGIEASGYSPADQQSMQEIVIFDYGNMTADMAKVDITITGKRIDGSAFTHVITQLLAKVKAGVAGVSAVNGILNNDSLTLPATPAGVVASFALAAGLFKVYYGATDVTNDATFAVVAAEDCTGAILDTAGHKGEYSISAMPIGKTIGRLVMTATYLGVTITKIFKVSKSLAGVMGIDATVYDISCSALVLVKSPSGAFTPGTVTFSFSKTTGITKVAWCVWYKTYYSTNGSTWELLSDGGEISEWSISITPQATYKAIKIEIYRDEWQVHKVDEQTVLIVSDGSDGRSVNMKPFVATVADLPTTGNTDNDGRIVASSGHLYMWDATTSTWSDCGLIQGPQGIQGGIGPNGSSLYTWLKYAYSATPAWEDMYELSGDRTFIGLAYNKSDQQESHDYRDYQWSQIKGEPGADAVTVEIDKQVTSIDADGNVFTLAVHIQVKRGENYLEYGAAWSLTHTNTGLTDTDVHTGSDAYDRVMNFIGFTEALVKVGYCDIVVTVGSLLINKRITISRNAIQGCIVRTSEWVHGVEYRNDKDEVTFPRYLDVVVRTIGPNLFAYTCLHKHTSGVFDTDHTINGYWEQMSAPGPIYTPLLVAPQASINLMQSQQILLGDGMSVQAGISAAVTEGLDYRYWSGGSIPEIANWSVDEDGKMKALAGIFGLLKIIGSSIESKSLKISDDPIELKSVATAAKTYTIPSFCVDSDGILLDQNNQLWEGESAEVTVDADCTLPTAYWVNAALEPSGSNESVFFTMVLEVWNNGALAAANEVGMASYLGSPMTAGSGVSLTGVTVDKGTVWFKMKAILTGCSGTGYVWFRPILSALNTGWGGDIVISAWVRRTVIGSDGVSIFANQNRYLYFRGANDTNDEFEVKLNTISILLKGGKATISGLPTFSSELTSGMMYRDSNGFLKIV